MSQDYKTLSRLLTPFANARQFTRAEEARVRAELAVFLRDNDMPCPQLESPDNRGLAAKGITYRYDLVRDVVSYLQASWHIITQVRAPDYGATNTVHTIFTLTFSFDKHLSTYEIEGELSADK